MEKKVQADKVQVYKVRIDDEEGYLWPIENRIKEYSGSSIDRVASSIIEDNNFIRNELWGILNRSADIKPDQFKEIFDIPIESIKWEPRTIAGMIHKYDESLHEVLNIEEARARLKKKE